MKPAQTLRSILLTSLFIALSACQPSSESVAGPVAFRDPAFVCSSSDGGLGCVAEACHAAGGVFSEQLKSCSCGSKSTFSINSGVPQCSPKRIENPCLTKYQGFTEKAQTLTDDGFCSSFTRVDSNDQRFGTLFIEFTPGDKNERQKFASWADTRFWNEFNYQFWQSPSVSGDFISIGGSAITNSLAIDGYLHPYNLPDESVNYLNFYPSPKHFVTAEDAINYLAGRSSPSTNLAAAARRLEKTNPVLSKLFMAFQRAPENQSYEIESRYKEGCLRSCVAKTPRYEFENFTVGFQKYYFHGALYRSEFVLGRTDRDILATLILANSDPSVAIEFTQSASGLTTHVVAYDKYGSPLFTKKGLDSDSIETERVVQPNSSNPELKVAFCEAGISSIYFKERGLGTPLLQGPNPESFFGWSNSVDDYWNGRFDLNAYGLPNPGGNSSHAANTASVLLQELIRKTSIGLIPLGITSCIYPSQIQTWWNAFKDSGAKVVNISATEELDQITCNKELAQHPLFSEPNSALWVVAGGNQGKQEARGCPQHLIGNPSLIVVGANEGASMHRQSNFGSSFIDIAAPGNSVISKEWGTSFAAPRVSQVAANLFHKYPSLKPAQIRRAILLGATIPAPTLPVFSKGYLNARDSDLIASGLSRNQPILEILNQTFCGRRKTSCSITETKLEIDSKIQIQIQKRNP